MQKNPFALGMIAGLAIMLFAMIVFLFSPLSFDFRKSLEPCTHLFQEIKMLEMTDAMQLGDSQTSAKHLNLLQEYVEKGCPKYKGLEMQINAYNQTIVD
jgi:hypothetical protein